MLKALFRSPADREAFALADPIIDRLVEKTGKRLAQVKDYRKVLRRPVLEARERLAALIARIPGLVDIGPAAWSRDEGVRPLFATAADAARAFSDDEGVRSFFVTNASTECYGMLALQQTERKVLATVMQGNLQVEVARSTLSFSEPQIFAPGRDEAAVREELAVRALENLALRAMENVGAMRSERRELEKERALLQSEVRVARRRGAGFGDMGGGAEPRKDLATLEAELARAAQALEKSATQNLLPVLLDEMLGTFAHPEEHLSIEPCTVTLDAMNFVIPPSPQAVTPRAATLRLGPRGPFAVLIARFARAELRERENRMAEAAKYL
jgi:hypothetical protein